MYPLRRSIAKKRKNSSRKKRGPEDSRFPLRSGSKTPARNGGGTWWGRRATRRRATWGVQAHRCPRTRPARRTWGRQPASWGTATACRRPRWRSSTLFITYIPAFPLRSPSPIFTDDGLRWRKTATAAFPAILDEGSSVFLPLFSSIFFFFRPLSGEGRASFFFFFLFLSSLLDRFQKGTDPSPSPPPSPLTREEGQVSIYDLSNIPPLRWRWESKSRRRGLVIERKRETRWPISWRAMIQRSWLEDIRKSSERKEGRGRVFVCSKKRQEVDNLNQARFLINKKGRSRGPEWRRSRLLIGGGNGFFLTSLSNPSNYRIRLYQRGRYY